MKNRVLLENYYLPGDLERPIGTFVDHDNNQRSHEGLGNLIPADDYHGKGVKILKMRDEIKRQTFRKRRLQHQNAAAYAENEIEPEPPLRNCLSIAKNSDDGHFG